MNLIQNLYKVGDVLKFFSSLIEIFKNKISLATHLTDRIDIGHPAHKKAQNLTKL